LEGLFRRPFWPDGQSERSLVLLAGLKRMR
jgi:hypothetical protein